MYSRHHSPVSNSSLKQERVLPLEAKEPPPYAGTMPSDSRKAAILGEERGLWATVGGVGMPELVPPPKPPTADIVAADFGP